MFHLTLRRLTVAVAVVGLIAVGSFTPLVADEGPSSDTNEGDSDGWIEEVVEIFLDIIDKDPDAGAKIEGDGRA